MRTHPKNKNNSKLGMVVNTFNRKAKVGGFL